MMRHYHLRNKVSLDEPRRTLITTLREGQSSHFEKKNQPKKGGNDAFRVCTVKRSRKLAEDPSRLK